MQTHKCDLQLWRCDLFLAGKTRWNPYKKINKNTFEEREIMPADRYRADLKSKKLRSYADGVLQEWNRL